MKRIMWCMNSHGGPWELENTTRHWQGLDPTS